MLLKIVDGRNEKVKKAAYPLVKTHSHQTCQRGKGVRRREPVYLRDPDCAIAREP